MHSQWMTQSKVRIPSHERVRLGRITKLTLTKLGTPTIAPLPSSDMQVTTVSLLCCLLSCDAAILSDKRTNYSRFN